MKKIMKRAWEIFRKAGVKFATALKMSWVVAKKEAWLEDHNNLFGGELTWVIWTGYGHIRAYYKCDKWSKYQNNKKEHFVEL